MMSRTTLLKLRSIWWMASRRNCSYTERVQRVPSRHIILSSQSTTRYAGRESPPSLDCKKTRMSYSLQILMLMLLVVDYQFTGQPVLIGGTMGTCSYVLTGTEKGMAETFGSTCHGAGRAHSRAKSRCVSLWNFGVLIALTLCAGGLWTTNLYWLACMTKESAFVWQARSL